MILQPTRDTDTNETDSNVTRSPFLDNAKALLIAIVVFAHLFELVLRYDEPALSFYRTILMFHMPAFAFVAGRLSRPEVFTPRGIRSLILLAWGYLLVNGLNHLWSIVETGETFSPIRIITMPYFALWFLLALFWWRLLLPLFAVGESRRAAVISVGLAALVAVLSGYLLPQGNWMTLSRTFVFLPFFVTGWRAGQQGWTMPRTMLTRTLALLTFSVVFAAFFWFEPISEPELLFGRSTYAEMGIVSPVAWVRRLGLLAVNGALVAAFLQWVPDRKVAFTPLGATTLSIYVWHAFAIRLIRHLDMREFFGETWGRTALWTIVALAVFGTGAVAALTTFLMSGKRKV